MPTNEHKTYTSTEKEKKKKAVIIDEWPEQYIVFISSKGEKRKN